MGSNIFSGRRQGGLFDRPVAVLRYSSVGSSLVKTLVLLPAVDYQGFAHRAIRVVRNFKQVRKAFDGKTKPQEVNEKT
jgi:hypothetical protein